MEINLTTAPVEEQTPKAVLAALIDISSPDCDFIGENGEDYLWDIAKQENFESNRDYVVAKLSNETNLYKIISEFFEMWAEHDNYYFCSEYEVTENEAGEIISISFAYATY